MRSKNNLVEIKGQKEGLWIYLDDQIPTQELFVALEKKLADSNNFFAGAEATINTGTRSFAIDEEQHLRDLVEQEYALRIKNITQTDPQEINIEEPSQDTVTIPGLSSVEASDVKEPENLSKPGVASEPESELRLHSEREKNKREDFTESVEEPLDKIATDDDEFMKFLDETFRIPVKHKWEQQQPTYSSDYLYENEENAFYFRGTVRSGQTLEYPGNIVILGDVNPGAYVIASGDIIVMGRLSGVVHAGAEGEERAVVIGAGFSPSQLRIAKYIGRSPDEYPRSRNKRSRAEKAYIKDGTIVIEPIL